jgi:hypothetical protein
MLVKRMKPGLVYALWVVIFVMAVVALFQQRKLAELRATTSRLETDARAVSTTRGSEAAANAELQRELRQLRFENEQLRQELQRSRPATRN